MQMCQGRQVFLTTQEVANRWRMSPRSLEGWRDKGIGPTYHVIGSRVRYHIDDIIEFESRQKLGSSSE